MESRGKLPLDISALKVPNDLRMLLQCRHLSVYDVLVILANTMNKVDGEWKVRDKEMEEFMAKVLEIISGGGSGDVKVRPSDGTVDRASLTESFREWLDRVVVTDFRIERPDENAGKKWRLVLQRNHLWDNGQVAIAEIDLMPLVEAMKAVDVTETQWEATQQLDRVDVECYSKEDKKELMFRIPLVDKTGYMAGLMSPADKTKLDSFSFDTANNLLVVNGATYKLTPVDVEITVTGYGWEIPTVSNFGYNEIGANGGTVSPKFRIEQERITFYSNGTQKRDTLTATDMQEAALKGFKVEFESDADIDVNGDVTVNASTSGSRQKVATVTMYVENKSDEDGHSAFASTSVYQAAAEFALSNSVNTSNVAAAGATITVPILKKTNGVTITGITTTDDTVATAALNSAGNAVVITVKKNENVGQARSCTISVNSSIGIRTIAVTQVGATLEVYAYSGIAATTDDIPADLTTGAKTKMASNGGIVTTKSELEDGCRIHWLLLPDGYRVSKVEDSDHDGVDVKTISVGGNTVYWIGDTTYIVTSYDWTIIKA